MLLTSAAPEKARRIPGCYGRTIQVQRTVVTPASASTNLSRTDRPYRAGDTLPSTAPSQDPRPSLSGISPAKNDPHVPCFMMPYYDNPRFHGREKILGEVANVLTLPSHGAAVADIGLRSFALSGPGGIGKSQVAGKFVYQHKDAFDAIFWVHADSVGKLQRSFGRIAVSIGLGDEDSTDAQDEVLTRDLVLGWLGQPLNSY